MGVGFGYFVEDAGIKPVAFVVFRYAHGGDAIYYPEDGKCGEKCPDAGEDDRDELHEQQFAAAAKEAIVAESTAR